MEMMTETTVEEIFFAPLLEDALKDCRCVRQCPELSDADFLRSGIGRGLDDVRNGRDWTQKAAAIFNLPLTVGRFFDSLKSRRRVNMTKEVSSSIRDMVDRSAPSADDPFAEHSEMDKIAVYAADGHWHASSNHEEPIDGKRQPVGHFFSLNLRTQSMLHLDVARPKKKREHDITALKRLDSQTIRMGEPTGRKVIIAYDPAVYDFDQWYKWKQSQGVYIITRKKSNGSLLYCGQNVIDRNDPRNAGIVSDRVGAPDNKPMLREIVYIDPASGKEYVFLTNEMTLPPGLIAFIYKKRWDVEKVFDEFKNKLMERKAWAKSLEAKCLQAHIMALTHNLMLMLERKLEEQEGIVDEKIECLRNKRIAADHKKIKDAGRVANPLVMKAYKALQRSIQFIRWLRCCLVARTSWRQAVEDLRPLMAKYLS